jgi:AraC-like DNA-binding protein
LHRSPALRHNRSVHDVNWQPFFSGLNRARAERGSAARPLRAKHEVDRRFIESLSLDEVADAACLSKYHLIRAFRDTFQRTPHRYLVERRIARAREMLERTDRSVTDICFDVGFESLGSFVRLFRREVGEPPNRYRKRFVRGGDPHRAPVPACLYEAFRNRPR